MIGVTRENLLSAIELFEQHPSYQQMGPGQRPKREGYIVAIENLRVEAIGAADDETDRGAILGAPLALRFPRGGVGLTIGVSLIVFALYYVCLIGGQALGDRGIIPPAISMWMADVLFAAAALWLLARMGTEGSTSRGGDTREMLEALTSRVKKVLGRA